MASDEAMKREPGEKSNCQARRFPLRQPENHRPPITRYSAAVPEANTIAVLLIGLQSRDTTAIASVLSKFPAEAAQQHAVLLETKSL